jgi:hypothetical protein
MFGFVGHGVNPHLYGENNGLCFAGNKGGRFLTVVCDAIVIKVIQENLHYSCDSWELMR